MVFEDEFFTEYDDKVKFDVCTELPPRVNSENNIWSKSKFPHEKFIMTNTMAELEVVMALMFFTSQALHFVFKQFGLPKIASQIIVRSNLRVFIFIVCLHIYI